MDEFLKLVTEYMALAAEAVATLVVTVGVLRTLVAWALEQVHDRTGPIPSARIRLILGRSLALALEFALAADILMTTIRPSWDQIARLAAIAAIRTFLSFFLQFELKSEARERTRLT